MSYLQRIEEINRYDLSHFRPWWVEGTRVGWVKPAFAAALAGHDAVFEVSEAGVRLRPALADPRARSAAVAEVVADLHQRGVIRHWYDELYPVNTGFSRPALLLLERAAVPLFGARAYGVHVNGIVRRDDGWWMWVARRSRSKPNFPGMLDNFVAGGQPAGLDLLDNVIKECGEEAGVPPALAGLAQPVGELRYCVETEQGLKPDTIFAFDLELPPDFEPHANDGEVESFELLPLAEVADLVANTRQFKPNCNLVVIDFLLRHGFIAADDPQRLALQQALHPTLPV